MRMRKKKHGSERMAACGDFLLADPITIPENKPTHLEIGCGKGRFACSTALAYSEINFIAIEKISDVLLLALERAKSLNIKNLHFINCNAETLSEHLPAHSIDRIYLNFNDPWPKKGHYKRRLTYSSFLNIYKQILKPDGQIFLKTDNIDYFNFSLEQFSENGFTLSEVTNDLHNSQYENENIHTEYEDAFSEKGFSINRCVASLS